MPSYLRDLAGLALIGLVVGAMLGVLAAGGYATWYVGGDLANIGFTTIFAFAPWEVGFFGEPFQTALLVGAAATLATTVAVPALGFRPPLTSHGTARWAQPRELKRRGIARRIERQKIRGERIEGLAAPIYGKLGPSRSREPFLTPRDRPHSIVTGPTRSGKGIGIIVPTLLTYKGSILCLDPKGENFNFTARRRAALHDTVIRIEPYAAGGRTHRYNPLGYVAAKPEHERYTEALRLAEALITAHGDNSWIDGCRDLFAATGVLAVERGSPTIGTILDLLSAPGETDALFAAYAEEVTSGAAARTFQSMLRYSEKTKTTYISILKDHGLGLWNDPAVRNVTSATDFDIQDMRRDPAAVFIIIPEPDLKTLAPLVRVLFQQNIALLQRREPDPKKGEVLPVLFLLDEFLSLGRMDAILDAQTSLASKGGRIMIIAQSLSKLRELYGRHGASALLSQSSVEVHISPNDEDTPEYISRTIGQYTRKALSRSWKSGDWATQTQERLEGAPLIRPEQVRTMPSERMVVMMENSAPIMAHRIAYFDDPALNALYKSQTGSWPQAPEPPPDALVDRKAAPAVDVEPGDTPPSATSSGNERPSEEVHPGHAPPAVKDEHGDEEGQAGRDRSGGVAPKANGDTENGASSAEPVPAPKEPTTYATLDTLDSGQAALLADLRRRVYQARDRAGQARRTPIDGDPADELEEKFPTEMPPQADTEVGEPAPRQGPQSRPSQTQIGNIAKRARGTNQGRLTGSSDSDDL